MHIAANTTALQCHGARATTQFGRVVAGIAAGGRTVVRLVVDIWWNLGRECRRGNNKLLAAAVRVVNLGGLVGHSELPGLFRKPT
jgi:hypothetical protein